MQNTKFNCHIYKEVNIRSNILLSFLMSSLFCKHRNKQINVNSIDTCSHITHLQSATLQSTFSTIESLRKHNYVEQLRRVLNQIHLT